MEKRYQVFISSTFQDLQPARQEVSQALLRADCFPAGMELFPAADEEQFEFIKQIIDQSDYYIIISAGRYGSIHPETGLSYTEMEYDYAVETGKPVIRLLHKDPFNQLKGEFIEQTDEGREKLESFREKLTRASLIRWWIEPADLAAEVVYGIMDCRKRFAAIGWRRANSLAAEDAETMIHVLRNEVQELKVENLNLEKRLLQQSSTLSPLKDLAEDVLKTIDRCVGATDREVGKRLFHLVSEHIEKNGFRQNKLVETAKDKFSPEEVSKVEMLPTLVAAFQSMELIEVSHESGKLTKSTLAGRLSSFFDAEHVL